MSAPRHPLQPLKYDRHGTLRFKENAIVRYLLDHGTITLNDLAVEPFSDEDREQFAQLIGYSFDGASELSYFSDDMLVRARAAFNSDTTPEEALQEKLDALRLALRDPIAELYGIHPDDLMRPAYAYVPKETGGS